MTTEILQLRADTGHAAGGDEGRTLCGLLASTVRRRGGEPAYSDRDDGGPWQTITWEQTRQQALELAAGLIGLGLRPGERVALMLPNRVEHVLADLAVVHTGGVPVTFYPTLAAGQVGTSPATAMPGSPCSTAPGNWPAGSPCWPGCLA